LPANVYLRQCREIHRHFAHYSQHVSYNKRSIFTPALSPLSTLLS
jgi:hypothetical protein